MNYRTTFRTGIIFLISFLLFLLVFHGLSYYLRQQQEQATKKQSRIILENVRERFNLFIRVPIAVGSLGAEYFATNDFTTKDYGPFNLKLLQLQKEILGLNIINAKGVIVRVFPEEMNKKAIGHVSQNYELLLKSFVQGNSYWFSPPFQLFQGIHGFAVYFPIIRNNTLKGWFATVLSTEAFAKQFKLEHFLNSYDLLIKDKKTNSPYYSTGLEPLDDQKVYEMTKDVDGRVMTFKIWKKNPGEAIIFPWSWSIVGSLILSFFTVLLYRVNEQKKKVRNQLQDVSTLLKLTSKEALGKLVDLQSEMYKLGSSDSILYLTHLIEQIDLLQTTACTKKEIECELIELLPCILYELDELKELTDKKNLLIKINPDNFVNVSLYINSWLFKNSVLATILIHMIVQAEAGTGIGIEYQKSFNNHTVVFHAQRLHQTQEDEESINLDRRISVARKILNMFDGELYIDHDLAGGLIVRISVPIPAKK